MITFKGILKEEGESLYTFKDFLSLYGTEGESGNQEAYFQEYVKQFPAHGKAGITETTVLEVGLTDPIPCIVYRNSDGRVVGFLSYYMTDAVGTVNTVWVDPQFRGKHIASTMMQYAKEHHNVTEHSGWYTKNGARFAYLDYVKQDIESGKIIDPKILRQLPSWLQDLYKSKHDNL